MKISRTFGSNNNIIIIVIIPLNDMFHKNYFVCCTVLYSLKTSDFLGANSTCVRKRFSMSLVKACPVVYTDVTAHPQRKNLSNSLVNLRMCFIDAILE